MANNRIVWEGLQELKAQLRQLPAELAGEGADIVERRATRAEARIRGGYPSKSGDLRAKLKVTHTRSRFGAISTVTNTSKAAAPFDSGSEVRRTAHGWNRGKMPPNPIFSQTVARERRGMHEDHKALLTRAGLVVTGDA